MPKVKELKKRHKEEYLLQIELDDGSINDYVVSTDLVVEYRLLKGKDLTTSMFQSFERDQTIDKVYQTTLKYVLKYQKSEYETKEYLRKKEVQDEFIELVISKLKKMRAIDDQVLIRSLVEYQFERQLNGPEKIKFGLKQKGFEDSLISQNLSFIGYREIENNLEALLSKRLSLYKNKSVSSAMRMMTSYLVQKGYDLNRVQAFIINHKTDFTDFLQDGLSILAEYDKAKKKYSKTTENQYELQQKIIASLLSKGYAYADIKKVLERR